MYIIITILSTLLISSYSYQSSLLSLLTSCSTSSDISLSSLTHTDPKDTDYTLTISTMESYNINICANTIDPCVGAPNSPNILRSGLGITDCSQLGLLSTAVWSGNSVSFTQGDQCGTSLYSSKVNFICGNTNQITAASGLASCAVTLTFETPLLCNGPLPNSDTSNNDTGSIVFIAFLFGGLGLYFIGGIIYKYTNRTGNDIYADYIPNKEFWLSLPGFIYDGNLYFIYNLKLLFHKCGLLSVAPILILSDSGSSDSIISNPNDKGYGTI